MRLPQSVSEKATKATKKPLEAVSIFGDAGTALEEFGITESGNEIQAYVKVSAGDPITLDFEIPCTEPQIVDIFIDGILRESNVTTSRPANTHRGKVAEVCACEIRPSGAKGKLEYCHMVVEDRKTTKDIRSSAPGFEDLHTSAVGTIEVRILREIHSAAKSNKDIKPEQAERGPTFEDNLRWWDVSRRVDSGIIAPKYQIGFINGRKTHGSSRKNINRSIEGYYLWASFKFIYRSASDIQAAGFDNIKADRSANSVGKMEKTQLAPSTAIDNKPILSLKALSGLSANKIGSSSLQPPDIGPMKIADDTERTGYVEQVKEKLQVVTPAKCTPTPDNNAVVSVGDQKSSQIARNQGCLHAYCETDYSDDESDKSQALPIKSLLEIANRNKAEHEQPIGQKVSKPVLPPGSRRAAIALAEQAIASYAKEPIVSDAQGENMVPSPSQTKDVQEGAVNEKSLDYRHGASGLSNKQEWDRHIEKLARVFSTETNSKHLNELSSSLEINPEIAEEAAHRRTDCDKSSDVSSLPQPSLSQVDYPRPAVQESGTNQELDLAPLQKATNVQRTTSNTIMRAKAGHYMSRSPLVDPDTEDIERQAKAMTNGKGNWRDRFTNLVQDLSAPSKNRALAGNLPGMAALEQPLPQNSATVSSQSSLSDTPKKRKFGELNVDAAGALRPDRGPSSSFSNQNGLGMSPKERREEIARKKRVKQDTLERAKAEADALRRQVEEIEAGHAAALAREEAELKELDIEIENIQGEAQALAARLRELHEQ